MKIVLNNSRIIKLLFIVALLLILANIVMLFIYFYVDNPDKFDFVQMVDLDQERNPAAVIPLESWLSDEMMQKIAEENNLSETAFL